VGVKFLYLLNAVTKPDLSGSIMTRDMLQTNVSTNIDRKKIIKTIIKNINRPTFFIRKLFMHLLEIKIFLVMFGTYAIVHYSQIRPSVPCHLKSFSSSGSSSLYAYMILAVSSWNCTIVSSGGFRGGNY
jgi:hypothetical protein